MKMWFNSGISEITKYQNIKEYNYTHTHTPPLHLHIFSVCEFSHNVARLSCCCDPEGNLRSC